MTREMFHKQLFQSQNQGLSHKDRCGGLFPDQPFPDSYFFPPGQLTDCYG
jgi:hypothetical protein